MRINNNIMAMNTHRQYAMNNTSVSKSTERLSSGFRINRAGDDAAGLAISEKMRAQIRGLQMASKNSEDAISLVQTAEGALTETHSILQRMRELAVQSATDTNDDTVDRVALNAEFSELKLEIDDIASKTTFNNKKLLDGTFGVAATIGAGSNIQVGLLGVSSISAIGFATGTHTISFAVAADPGDPYDVTFGGVTISGVVNADGAKTMTLDFGNGQIVTLELSEAHAEDDFDGQDLIIDVTADPSYIQTGANAGEKLAVTISDMRAAALGLESSAIDTRADAETAITTVNTAINSVSEQRAKLGAMQNRLEHKISNLDTSAENLQAAESRIRDLDMAKEMTVFTQNSILVQAATAMLAQANAAPQNVLSLLG